MTRAQFGPDNPQWTGDGPISFAAAHSWLAKHGRKTGACSRCGDEGKTEWAFLCHPAPYTRTADDYAEMCRSCHLKFDIASGERPANQNAAGFRKTHCKHGHEFTAENTRFRSDGKGRECRTCHRDAVRRAAERESWPVHQPGPAYEAPIPGLHWYGGCEDGYPRVNPETGVCEGCGGLACRECGRQDCPDHERVAA